MALGADEVHKIDDQNLRDAIIRVLTFNFTALRADSLQSDYRKHVREIIPDPIQRAIRQSCGDRFDLDYLVLPETCSVALPPRQVTSAAVALRMHPELPGQLAFHFAQVDAFLNNLDRLEVRVRDLLALIDGRSKDIR